MRRVAAILVMVLWLTPALARAQTHRDIAFAGDSIIHGTSATTEANSLTGRLTCSRPYWWIHNYGVDGATVTGAGGFPILSQNAVVSLLDNYIVVFVGLNDWSQGAVENTFKSDYTTFITDLEFLSPTIICVTPIWNVGEGTNNSAGYTLATLRADEATICTNRSHAVIDGLPLVTNDAAFFTDGTHPNDNGYAVYATNLSAALGALIP